MLVYTGDFISGKIKGIISKIYLNILLSDRVNRIKNIHNDDYKFEGLKLDFDHIGINIFSHATDIRNYYSSKHNTKNIHNSLFYYMFYLRKKYEFDENKDPYFIIDYEWNAIRNHYMFKFKNNFSHLISVSRSLAKATYEQIESNYSTPQYYIISKSVLDRESVSNKIEYVPSASSERDENYINSKFDIYNLYVYWFDLYEEYKLYYHKCFASAESAISVENLYLYYLYKSFHDVKVIYKTKLEINFYEYGYLEASKHDFLQLWRVLYKIAHHNVPEIKMIKLIVENKSGVKVHKNYLIHRSLGYLDKELTEAFTQYINNPELKFPRYTSCNLHIYFNEKIFKNIIKKYNNVFSGQFVLNDIFVSQINLYSSKINTSVHLGLVEDERENKAYAILAILVNLI